MTIKAQAPLRVLFDEARNFAFFEGYGGVAQIVMTEREAKAVASALGVPFSMCRPGTTIPVEAAA